MTSRVAALLALTLVAAAAEEPRRWDFEAAEVGKIAPGWQAAHTHEGQGSVWKVLVDETAPAGSKVLAQTADTAPNKFFNLCVADDASYQDVDASVSFKAVAGNFDRGGGLVWRYKDADNYYLARMNPLEDNFRVYKVEKGTRTMFESADVKIPSGEWHRLRIVQQGNRIRCFLDDKQYLAVSDDTFGEAGKIGLWTKADAVTYFDDLRACAP